MPFHFSYRRVALDKYPTLPFIKLFYCFIVETSSCKRYVCFNWKVTVNELKLTCKVSKLHYRVWILNQFGTEQAQCIPPTPLSKCYTYYSNGTISQNPKTNETVFIVHGHIDSHINGNWTCRHGKKRDLAQVEVTVLRTQGNFVIYTRQNMWS